MEDKYDHSFSDESVLEFYQSLIRAQDFQSMRLGVEGGFGKVPLRESFQLLSRIKTPGESLSDETFLLRERLAKFAILKKNVTFYMDDKEVGKISVLTDVGQELDADSFLGQNPIFYQLLLEDTTAFILKNYTPPRKETVLA